MINVSEEVVNKLKSSSLEMSIKVNLLNKDEGFIEELTRSVIDGNISVDKERDIRRNLSLTLNNTNNQYTPAPGAKIWIDKKLAVYIGVKTFRGIEWIPQGVFCLGKPVATSGIDQAPQVRIEGLDKMSTWGSITRSLTLSKGLNIGDAIKLILDGIESKFVFDDINEILPYDVNYALGQDRKQIVLDLVNMITWEIGYNVYGELRLKKPINPENAVVSWVYKQENYTLYAGSEKTIDDGQLYNHVLTIGASSQSAVVTAEAIHDDITSPFSTVNIGDRLYIHNGGSPDPLITTVELAQARSDYELRRKLQYIEKQNITLAPNFLHEEGDVVRLVDVDTNTNDNYELLRFNIPLTLTGTMTGECWRVRPVL